jgi:SOS-response transcriptional repressor LexA
MTCGCKTAAANEEDMGCSGGESFALRVLGEDMLPEFREGDIIIVEPDGALKDGSFVLACPDGEWMLRRLVRGDTHWHLRALNPAKCTAAADIALADLSAVHGLVIQKAVPGRRKLSKSYL